MIIKEQIYNWQPPSTELNSRTTFWNLELLLKMDSRLCSQVHRELHFPLSTYLFSRLYSQLEYELLTKL